MNRRYIFAEEAAQMLGVSINALAQWRHRGLGPEVAGRRHVPGQRGRPRVFYKTADVKAWVERWGRGNWKANP